jgi:uncharacterized protein (DUF1697 family)
MKRFVVLYRGINVGGNKIVKMEALRAMHAALGHVDVESYIQSGNLVLSAAGAAAAVARESAAAFEKAFGFLPKVMAVTGRRWMEIVAANSYAAAAKAHPKTVHSAICEGTPGVAGLQALLAKTGGTETFTVKANVVYLHAPDGFGTSKFAAGMEKASGVPMTVRNWRTLAEMIRGGNAS